EYAACLVDFIAGYQPALGLPYLADVARLDWALNAAFHAPAMPCLGVADLSAIEVERLPGLCLTLAAGATVIRSLYPLEHIWRACQADAPAGTVDLALGGCELLVLRRSDDAAFVSLSAGEAAFVTAV